MFQQKKDPKNTKEFIYLRSVICSKNVQILKVCVQSISQNPLPMSFKFRLSVMSLWT